MFIQKLSRLVELHFLLVITPESKKSNLLDISRMTLPEGITDAAIAFQDCFPKSIQDYWKDCASFSILVHDCPKSIHPAAWKTSRKGANFISNINPDIVHFDDISLRQTWTLSALKKKPIALSIHDPESHSGEKNWRKELARYLSFPKIDKFILHNSKQITPFIKNYKLRKDRVCSIPLGVYDIFREWSEDQTKVSERTILFFGRISPYKGLESLFRASLHVAEKIHGIRIIVAGKPIAGYQIPDPPSLQNGGKIEIMDKHISNDHLADLFNQSTVVVCPYIDATQSGVVLTSYAFNKPVIATDTGGLSEYVKHMKTGLLIQPGNDRQLADALLTLLQDKELQIKFKSGIKDLVADELNWDNISRETYTVYKKMMLP